MTHTGISNQSIHDAETGSGLPFESLSSLRSLNIEEDNVDYTMSRKAALIEMTDFDDIFRKTDPRGGFKLSERPIVIRDENGEARLYEYIVFNLDMNPIATITNFAKKEVPDFTACVLPYVRDYNHKEARKYSVGYPYNGSISSKESRSTKLTDVSSSKSCEEFWNHAKNWEKSIRGKSDNDIISEQIDRTRGWFSNKTKWYTIPEFDRENLKRTRFKGACGPSALAWLYRGFYPTFKEEYIPLHGEESTESYKIYSEGKTSYYLDSNPLHKEFSKLLGMDLLVTEIDEAMTPKNFSLAVDKYFPNHCIGASTFHNGHGAPRRAIQNGNPVFMVVFSGIELHYIIGFGTKDKYTWFGIHNDSWILVTDNGTKTSEHGYMPYYRNSNFFNFANKYVVFGEIVRRS